MIEYIYSACIQADQMITVIHLRVMRTLALCMDMYLETLNVLIPLLTNFALHYANILVKSVCNSLTGFIHISFICLLLCITVMVVIVSRRGDEIDTSTSFTKCVVVTNATAS